MFTEEEIIDILLTILKHFRIHPYIDEASSLENLSLKCFIEVKARLNGVKFYELVSYLEQTWYSEEELIIWGRRNFTHDIPFATTTMIVE